MLNYLLLFESFLPGGKNSRTGPPGFYLSSGACMLRFKRREKQGGPHVDAPGVCNCVCVFMCACACMSVCVSAHVGI